MEERKWEDMNVDCLVNIFGRVELESRVQAIPLVCKSWYQAVLNPLCWEKIIFPPMLRTRSSQTELIKFVVNRSQRRATILALPNSCDTEALLYVSYELPGLKTLALSLRVCLVQPSIISCLMIKWKNLEALKLENTLFIKDILEPIPIHLPHFALLDVSNCLIDGEVAATIVSHVPKLKALIMNQALVKKEDLILIMQGCKQLEHLDVRSCIGFEEDDEDILRLSSGIKHFQCDGSKAMDELFEQHSKRIASLISAEAFAITDTDDNYNIFDATDNDDE